MADDIKDMRTVFLVKRSYFSKLYKFNNWDIQFVPENMVLILNDRTTFFKICNNQIQDGVRLK